MLKQIEMVDTSVAQDKSPEGSAHDEASVGIGQNPTPPPQGNALTGGPTVNPAQQECPVNIKELLDHLVAVTRREQPALVPAPAPVASCAPIDKLSLHRAFTFTGEEDDVSETAEKWLEKTTKVVTKQLSCSDEHKLDCAVALLAGDALSW